MWRWLKLFRVSPLFSLIKRLKKLILIVPTICNLSENSGHYFMQILPGQRIKALPLQWKKFCFWTQDDTIYLYEFLIAHRSYIHNLSFYEIKLCV